MGVSVWVAQKDFDNWRSFLVLSPPITFVALFSSLLAILLILFNMKISQALILIFALAFISPPYIKTINWLDKHEESIIKKIKKYCDNWKSFLSLPSSKVFAAASVLLLAILLIVLIIQISQVLIFKAPFFSLLSKLLVIFEISQLLIFIFVFSLLCITISTWLKKPIKDGFDEIKEDFDDNTKLLEVIQQFYLQLSCNDKDKARIRDIKGEFLEKYKHEEGTIEKLIANLDKLKGYLFSMDLTSIRGLRLEDDLKKGIISEETMVEFRQEELPLPKNSIGVIKGDNKWVITDKEKKKTLYIVWKVDGKLKIFKKDNRKYLENEDFNIISRFKYFIKKEKG